MSVQIRTEGLEEILADLTKIDQNILKVSRESLSKAGQEGLALAQQIVPVDTGFLRSSLYQRVSSGATSTLEIGGTADYTLYQEFGTRRGVRPHYFIRSGSERAIQSLNQELAKIMQGI